MRPVAIAAGGLALPSALTAPYTSTGTRTAQFRVEDSAGTTYLRQRDVRNTSKRLTQPYR